MRIFLTLIVFLRIGLTPLTAQIVEKGNLQYKNSAFDVFVVHCDSSLIKRISIVENNNMAQEDSYFSSLSGQSPFFCITAGVVDSVCNPLGLCVENGQVTHALNRDNGSGNFFLKPNGVFTIEASKVSIVNSDAYNTTASVNAIQSGPMLIVEGKIHPAFDPKSQNRYIRCGVGIYMEKGEPFLVFIKSATPVSFYEFASIFKDKYKCNNALNLENGSLTSMHLPTIKKIYSSKTKICRYIFIKL